MEIAGINVPGVMASGAAAFVAVWQLSKNIEKIQSRRNRQFVGRWLLALQGPDRHWNSFFSDLFIKFFGPIHVSWQSVRKSIALTFFLLVAVFLFDFGKIGLLPPLSVFIYISCAAFMNDYLSLGKTRYLLTQLTKSDSLIRMMLIVFADVLTSTILYAFLLWVSFGFILIFADFSTKGLSAIVRSPYFFFGLSTTAPRTLFDSFFGTTYRTVDPLAAGFYRHLYEIALLTSAWLWVYIVAAQVLRTLRFVPRFFSWYSKIADLREHPVRAVGFVAAVLSAGIAGLWNAFL
jgi:hypothetical protein